MPAYSRLQSALLGIYFWSMFVLLTVSLYASVLSARVLVWMSGRDDYGRSIHRVATIWGRTILHLTPGWKVTVSGREHLPKPEEPVVIVANHESMADIWAMYETKAEFRWLSKAEVFAYPIIGSTMRWARYVPIKRGDKESHAKALEQSEHTLDQGVCMLYFPEGTRSKTGELRPFKTGAFRLAEQKNLPILPIAISGTRDLMPKGSILPGRAAVHLNILPPMKKPAHLSLEEWAAEARDHIIAALPSTTFPSK